MPINFSKLSNEELINLVNEGIGSNQGLAGSMELQRRLNLSFLNSIKVLDKNIQIQSKTTTHLTIAMYFLTGISIILTMVQIGISKGYFE